jgi:nucleotide-binding universal stress UspA family protein
MERLLVFGDDMTEGADAAWQWICAQDWSGWRCDVVTVKSDAKGPDLQVWGPEHPRVAPETSGLSQVRHLAATGDPREVLANIEADLLVIGPRGGGLLKKLHLGSVAESLLDRPGVPTVIAKSHGPARRVTLATDGSVHARAAERLLLDLPWASRMHVDVVSVDDTGDGTAELAIREAEQELTAAGIDAAATVIRPSELDLTVSVRHELEEFVHAHECDLLAMGTHGLQGIDRLRAGSNADYLAHHIDCAILLVREDTAGKSER